MPFGGLLTLGIVGAVGGIASSAIGANASQNAAQTQANAANNAAQLQYQEFQQQQQNIAPWLQAGQAELPTIQTGIQPGGQFNSAYPSFDQQYGNVATQFQAPTAEQAAATPGEQFATQQMLQALQRSQAATGITGGGAAKGIAQYVNNLASTNYQQAYGNALSTFNTNLGAAQNLYQQGFNTYNTQQGQNYNRAAALAGVGQTAVQQLGQAGQNYANQAGNYLTQAGNASAAGQVGVANAINSGIGIAGNSISNAALLNYLNNSSYGKAPTPTLDDATSLGLSQPL